MLEPAIAHILASIAWCIVECSMLIVRLYEVPSAVAGGLGILEISRASRSLLLFSPGPLALIFLPLPTSHLHSPRLLALHCIFWIFLLILLIAVTILF